MRLGGRIYTGDQGWHPLSGSPAVLDAIRESGANLLHAHLLRADAVAREASRKTGLPCLLTEHGIHAWAEKGVFLRPLVKRWYLQNLSERLTICAISRKVARGLRQAGVPSHQIRLVPNGIDLGQFTVASTQARAAARRGLNIPRDASPLLLQLGSLIERKNPLLSLKALKRLRAEAFPQAMLLFAGDGPQREMLKKKAQQLGIESHIRFAGRIHDPIEALHAADLLIHPAKDEPFGLVLAEALAAGLPAITLAGAISPEILPPSPMAYMVEGEDPATWAMTAMESTERCQKEGDRLARSCRLYAEKNFPIGKTAERYLDIYKDALDQRA